MAGRRRGEPARDLDKAAERFRCWRQSRVFGERIPEPLWNQAVELAGRYGISRTASSLRVGYYELQKRAATRPAGGSAVPGPREGFVELPPLTTGECLIEFENASGRRMRVQIKGSSVPDLVALSRSFWDAG